MKEEWRSVVGYEGLYEVSNHGRVKSLAKMWLNGEKIVFESMCRAAKELNISRDMLRVHNSFGNVSWKLI